MPTSATVARPASPDAPHPAGRQSGQAGAGSDAACSAVAPGARRGRGGLTLLEVAKALGVSRTTVSNAYNRPEKLSATLREEILDRARELGYFGPDPTARAMRRRDLAAVGVVFHHDLSYALSDPTAMAFLSGVAAELDRRHLALHLIPFIPEDHVGGAQLLTIDVDLLGVDNQDIGYGGIGHRDAGNGLADVQ